MMLWILSVLILCVVAMDAKEKIWKYGWSYHVNKFPSKMNSWIFLLALAPTNIELVNKDVNIP